MGKDYRSRHWMVSKKNRIKYSRRSGIVKLIAPIIFNLPKDADNDNFRSDDTLRNTNITSCNK